MADLLCNLPLVGTTPFNKDIDLDTKMLKPAVNDLKIVYILGEIFA